MDTHVHQNIPLPIFMQSEPTKSPSRHQVEFSMSLVTRWKESCMKQESGKF